MRKAGWREYAIASILLLAGLVYLILQVLAMLKGDRAIRSDADTIHINKFEALNYLRTGITIAACLFGAILLVRQRKSGWMLALAMLLLFSIIAVAGLVSIVSMRLFDAGFYVVLGGASLLVFLLVSLFSLSKKFVVKKNDWIRVILLCTLLGVIYFWLQ